jgi:hypothetical protein
LVRQNDRFFKLSPKRRFLSKTGFQRFEILVSKNKVRFIQTLRNRKRRIQRRLDPERRWTDTEAPMMSATNIHFEMAERSRAVNYGGIGAMHLMGQKLGLAEEIDGRVKLLKVHLPYHESDHVLNLAYNALLDGLRLQDIELRRNDEAFLDGLGAQRIPDPTTSGDFTRRFDQNSVLELMEAINATRRRVWEEQPWGFLLQAFIDIDGTIAPTLGECKGGMGLSYKGIWGYAPLIISLATAVRSFIWLIGQAMWSVMKAVCHGSIGPSI